MRNSLVTLANINDDSAAIRIWSNRIGSPLIAFSFKECDKRVTDYLTSRKYGTITVKVLAVNNMEEI